MDKFPISFMTHHPIKFLSTILATTILLPTTYALYLHHHLSLKIQHETRGIPFTLSPSSLATKTFTSIPSSAFDTPHLAVHDIARKTIHLSSKSPAFIYEKPSKQDGGLIIFYLRNTMRLFSTRLPQAFILRRVVSPEARKSFETTHLRSLEFNEGDLACGVYRVVSRTSQKVEFEILPLPGMGDVVKGGRLAISIKPGEEKENERSLVICTETIMWKNEGDKGLMPLEMGVGRWMHELAAWWLLDAGGEILKKMT